MTDPQPAKLAPAVRSRPGALRWGIAIVLLVLAAWAGWHTYRVIQQRKVVDYIDELGGVVVYDFEDTDPEHRNDRPSGPSFVATLLGNDYTHDIVDVNLRTTDRTSLSDDDLRRVSSLSAVRVLSVSNGGGITDEGMEALARMPALEKLTLAKLPNVTDAGLAVLARLPRLRKLELITLPKITDEGLQPLDHLTQLRELQIANCQIDGSGWQHLHAPELRLLEATTCKVDDEALKHLSSAGSLEELSITNNQLQGSGLANLTGLSKLVRLRLTNNEKLDPKAAMPHLKALASLELINLRGTPFDRPDGEELAKALPKCDITIDAGTYDPEESKWNWEESAKE